MTYETASKAWAGNNCPFGCGHGVGIYQWSCVPCIKKLGSTYVGDLLEPLWNRYKTERTLLGPPVGDSVFFPRLPVDDPINQLFIYRKASILRLADLTVDDPKEPPDDRFVNIAADRAYRFLCGLQLSDLPVRDQKEYLSVVRELGAALGPGKVQK